MDVFYDHDAQIGRIFQAEAAGDDEPLAEIAFQRGPLKVEGSRLGVQNEDLINLVIMRLHHQNQEPFRCRENSLAITALEEARNWLYQRTRDRELRGVEGTDQP